MKRNWKWPEVWLEIAEAFYTLYIQRTRKQKGITEFGICSAIDRITRKRNFFGVSICNMLNPSIDAFSRFWWQVNYLKHDDSPGDAYRAQFAEHMAGLSHEDFEDFIKGGSQ